MKKQLIAAAFVLMTFTGCVHTPPNLNPEATVDFQNTQVLHMLDLVRDIAILGNQQTPQIFSTKTTRAVVKYHEAAIKAVNGRLAGWKGEVLGGLDSLLGLVSSYERVELQPYVFAIETILQETP